MNRKRIFTIIQVGNLSDIPSRTYDISLVVAVVINIFIALFDTFPESAPYERLIWWVEAITVAFFMVDYVLRIVTADYLYEDIEGITPAKARLKFIFSWAGLVDFLSCVPFFVASGGGALRMFRIIRILRVFRIHHYADPLRVIGDVVRKKKGQLLSSCFIVLMKTTEGKTFGSYIESEITGEGKHYKLTYYGDPRYMTTVGKTPSDVCAGDNNAMNICRDML